MVWSLLYYRGSETFCCTFRGCLEHRIYFRITNLTHTNDRVKYRGIQLRYETDSLSFKNLFDTFIFILNVTNEKSEKCQKKYNVQCNQPLMGEHEAHRCASFHA